jgi:hypothetical protein
MFERFQLRKEKKSFVEKIKQEEILLVLKMTDAEASLALVSDVRRVQHAKLYPT